MKKLIAGVVTAVVLSGGMAYADDAQVSVGLKGWSNSWEVKETTSGGTTSTLKSDNSVLMVGPSISVKKDKMFGGITYLTATSDYTFSNLNLPNDSLKFKRNDLDLIAGYMFHPRFGAFVGYKSLSADASYSGNYLGVPITGSGTRTLTGPGVGITGNYPFEALPLSLYGNLSGMSLKDKFDFKMSGGGSTSSTSTSSDLSGASIELGASYSFSNNISANLGIKNQSFTGSDKGTTTTETFSGLTFGANYTFASSAESVGKR